MKEKKERRKLIVLRWVFILLTTYVVILWKITRVKKLKRVAIPSVWLRHYLIGSGKPMKVSEKVVSSFQLYETLLDGIKFNNVRNSSNFCNNDDASSILANLVGGFTYQKVTIDKWILIEAVDRYDWHPVMGYYNSKHYRSQTFEHFPVFVYKILLPLLPKEYFFVVQGKAAISHKLWHDMAEGGVGAKSFDTIIKIYIPQNVVEKYKDNCKKRYEEKIKELPEAERRQIKYTEDIIKQEIGEEEFEERRWFLLEQPL